LYKNNSADPEILSSCEEVCLVQDRLKISWKIKEPCRELTVELDCNSVSLYGT